MKILSTILLLALATFAQAEWFEDLKASDNPEDLYRVLYHMPKGLSLIHI